MTRQKTREPAPERGGFLGFAGILYGATVPKFIIRPAEAGRQDRAGWAKL
jgi:hypothetical protein